MFKNENLDKKVLNFLFLKKDHSIYFNEKNGESGNPFSEIIKEYIEKYAYTICRKISDYIPKNIFSSSWINNMRGLESEDFKKEFKLFKDGFNLKYLERENKKVYLFNKFLYKLYINRYNCFYLLAMSIIFLFLKENKINLNKRLNLNKKI